MAATINSQHGRGKHDTSAFEAMYGQKYHHPMLCSKEEAHKCWTLPDLLGVTNNEAFALYIAQHFYVGEDDYTSSTNAEDNNESGYFLEDELSKSEEQEVTDEFFMCTSLIIFPRRMMKASSFSELLIEPRHNPYYALFGRVIRGCSKELRS